VSPKKTKGRAATKRPAFIATEKQARSHLIPLIGRLQRLPYWLLAAILLALLALWSIITTSDLRVIFLSTIQGLGTTLYVSAISYICAAIIGLGVAILRVSPHRLFREVASFYVEIIRGIPMLVILAYIAFVGAPAIIMGLNWLFHPLIAAGVIPEFQIRAFDFTARAILALTLGYSAFISEIFRGGIESVDKGQLEAALALGLKRGQAMRRIVLPQAFRYVLPPLGNELVSMIKDSALVSALGVQDISQLGKLYAASNFKYLETYNIVTFLYLTLTITLSLLTRRLENFLKRKQGN